MRAIGYHGTSVAAAQRILASGFEPSRNDYDWLGDGAYFFQDAPVRAMEWARQRHGPDAAVVAAEIDLADCMDLLDIPGHAQVARTYTRYRAELEERRLPLPRQSPGAHRLDCAVLNYLSDVLKDEGVPIQSIRAVFTEGNATFRGSALLDLSHVQIAVRNPSAILRSWRVT
jgi:hypothetical protein